MRFHKEEANDSESDEETLEKLAKKKKIEYYYEQI